MSQISLCGISQLNSTKAEQSFSKMDDEKNLEFQKEDEKAIILVKSASKNLRDVKVFFFRDVNVFCFFFED